jgi:hypothetical protein
MIAKLFAVVLALLLASTSFGLFIELPVMQSINRHAFVG